jgi:hypothetical protein
MLPSLDEVESIDREKDIPVHIDAECMKFGVAQSLTNLTGMIRTANLQEAGGWNK